MAAWRNKISILVLKNISTLNEKFCDILHINTMSTDFQCRALP